MAVVVDEGYSNETKYENGMKVQVADGHLHVFKNVSEVVAIHAPGKWATAEVQTKTS